MYLNAIIETEYTSAFHVIQLMKKYIRAIIKSWNAFVELRVTVNSFSSNNLAFDVYVPPYAQNGGVEYYG